jgi:hypothetical protein
LLLFIVVPFSVQNKKGGHEVAGGMGDGVLAVSLHLILRDRLGFFSVGLRLDNLSRDASTSPTQSEHRTLQLFLAWLGFHPLTACPKLAVLKTSLVFAHNFDADQKQKASQTPCRTPLFLR